MSHHKYRAQLHTIGWLMAIVLSVIAITTSIIWIYYVAIWMGIPSGIIAYLIWKWLKKDQRKRNIAIPILLGIASILLCATALYAIF